MKITYLANVRIPTEKAHGLQIMKMGQAFNNNGAKVELVIAKRANRQFDGVDPFNYYQIKVHFLIKRLPLINMVEIGRSLKGLSVIIQNTSFALSAFFHLVGEKTDIIYSRDEFSLFLLSFFKKNLILELHTFPQSKLFLYRWLFKRVKKIIVITNQLKALIVKQGVDPRKIIVAPDGVDLKQFNIQASQEECRKRFNLPLNKKLVLYTGHLWQWKGAYILAEAAKYLPEDYLVIFIGVMEYDINKLKQFIQELNLNNIKLIGHRSPVEIPYWLKSADCVVLPNSGQKKISQLYTSPIKLFEYMASQKPIVASNLPSIAEILNNNNAILVTPDDPQTLAQGIKKAVNSPDISDKLAKQAFDDVQQYSWDKRAGMILDFIK